MRSKIAALFLLPLTVACAETAPAGDATPTRADGANGADGQARDGAGEPDAERGVVLFLGTSLTAGYGLDEGAAFPALIQQRIDAAGLPFRVVNAGLSGETSAGGLRRIEWSLQNRVHVLVLELGANDGLRGLSVGAMRENLEGILDATRAEQPDAAIVLLGMEAPPNLGPRYTADFRQVYRDLAREYDAALVPFLLEGVAAQPALNLSDGIHPNEEGHRRLASTVWRTLEPVLEERAAARR